MMIPQALRERFFRAIRAAQARVTIRYPAAERQGSQFQRDKERAIAEAIERVRQETACGT